MKLIYQILFALLGAILVGMFASPALTASLKPFGDIYINLLKTIALPLVFFSLIKGIVSHQDTKLFYKTGAKSILLFLVTGVFAALVGALSGLFLGHEGIPGLSSKEAFTSPSFSLDSFLSLLIPSNFLGAFVKDSTVQITLLAILIGVAILQIPKKEKNVVVLMVDSINTVLLSVIKKIFLLAPLTVFVFTSFLISHFETKVFWTLLQFVLVLFGAYFIQYMLLGIYIKAISKLPFLPFIIKSLEYQWIAFSTGSSKASLPSTIEIAQRRLGISKEKASFVLPLGAAINMQGLAIYLVLSVLFVAKSVGFAFSLQDYLLLILLSSVMSIGTAGIPGGALATLPLLFGIWDLPFEYIPLLVAIDPLINMARSALNITGDVAITLILDKLQGGLKVSTYKKLETS